MQNTTERRQHILEYISDRRKVTISEITNEFGICEKTARNDIHILSCSYPLLSITGRYGGGVRAMDGWYISRRYLRDDQEALLRDLLVGLQPKEQETMRTILTAFAKPKIRDGVNNG